MREVKDNLIDEKLFLDFLARLAQTRILCLSSTHGHHAHTK